MTQVLGRQLIPDPLLAVGRWGNEVCAVDCKYHTINKTVEGSLPKVPAKRNADSGGHEDRDEEEYKASHNRVVD